MRSRITTHAMSAVLAGALGLTSTAALAPTPAAQAAQPDASRQSTSRLWPTITPAGGANGQARIAADITARAPIDKVQVLVDGTAVSPLLVRDDAAHHRVSYTPRTLAWGLHTVRVTAWDTAGYYAWQEWSVHIPAAVAAPARPTLQVGQTRVQPGGTVTVSGQGFTPGARVSLSLGGVNTGAGGRYGSTVADGTGRFSRPVTLTTYPDGTALTPGAIVLVAHTASYDQKATAQLHIVSGTTAVSAKPGLTVDRTHVRVGETVRVSGQGFQPGLRISLSMGGVNTGASGTYGSAVVDSAGRFSLPVTLTAYPDGSALTPGTIVLLAHADWSSPAAESQKATVPLQIVR